jgi:hypothetical protein
MQSANIQFSSHDDHCPFFSNKDKSILSAKIVSKDIVNSWSFYDPEMTSKKREAFAVNLRKQKKNYILQ